MSGPDETEAMVGTLHLERADYARMTSAAGGGLLVELTEAGELRLVDRAARFAAALEEGGDRREAWLRSLTNEELVALASSRLGGPAPEVVAEAARRMEEIMDRLGPALGALRSAGVIGGAR
jgi:N-methylhydantoinase A/oxoprolinase/acetone carboxylase beta subunit